jgi:hypothetical protein
MMRDGLAAAMESGRLNKRATASRDSHAGTQHTPTASTTTHNHKHITHTHIDDINNIRISYKPVPRGSAPGPRWGLRPQTPYSRASRSFFKQNETNPTCKKVHIFGSAPLRYGTIFNNFRLLRPHPHAWGTPKCRKTDPHPPP